MLFDPGFRLSIIDVAVILMSLIFSVWVYKISMDLAFYAIFITAHFFLFCNVVRMSRKPELIWAGIFLILAYISLSFELLNWYIVVPISTIVTMFLVYFEIKKPSYHGILWEKFNPNLPEWFKNKN